jgi:hypothetical protein
MPQPPAPRHHLTTATAGQVSFHRAGPSVADQADQDTDLVDVSHPALAMAEAAPQASRDFHPAPPDRVVILGEETLRVRATGATTRVPWAWAYTLRDGLITRIEAIEDLSAVADTVAEALANAEQRHPDHDRSSDWLRQPEVPP